MGFDIERFSGKVNEGLLCSICRDVLEEPLQAPCEHAFCSACIQAWLTHYNSCPEDRLTLWPSDLKPIFRYMKNDLNALKIRCDNESRGCKALVRLDALKTHLKEECGHVMVFCSNEGCEEKYTRRELETHLKNCKFQTADCARGCGLKVSKNEESEHNCIAELRKAMIKNKKENEAKIQELKKEMESRLDSHRVHMVYKETTLQNQIEDLNAKVAELLRETKTLKAQKSEELLREDPEKKEILDWLRSLKYQDEIAERYCSSCNKRYLYVRKDTLHCLNDQVNLSCTSPKEEEAVLSHIRCSRGTKSRSWCSSSPGTGQGMARVRSQNEETSFNRAVVESWRRTPDVSSSHCDSQTNASHE
ncbi:E3 ubiquitin-protein ligase NRDP1-like isoform X1 [Montipora capricornis]|uniref:E3 ubiquitin-protein ligase NRDP1-like isoform X1 n=1 Tax=Montipora foliosa TaxID=591990 RepID=UPI0035F0FB64